ncbi:hypothetical protein K437DRAFT_265322 [Tilletiaria anomala UBC 951]|uniref:SANT domain-containing protein n=1 Tax=Tilletiaria anomala (strain ATCC 24038 / CBS 436.72 / UBC 951) TaxID=1037660 RepID=A0A066V3N7_TILAU|nr:uncharacterized protein K437DRAFT_265322 [Tilletiaria anomala UBC 951]KDN36327.1 hypothetical protein K437DRAFT_265322 [Tilletiaria anomala UBC 951]
MEQGRSCTEEGGNAGAGAGAQAKAGSADRVQAAREVEGQGGQDRVLPSKLVDANMPNRLEQVDAMDDMHPDAACAQQVVASRVDATEQAEGDSAAGVVEATEIEHMEDAQSIRLRQRAAEKGATASGGTSNQTLAENLVGDAVYAPETMQTGNSHPASKVSKVVAMTTVGPIRSFQTREVSQDGQEEGEAIDEDETRVKPGQVFPTSASSSGASLQNGASMSKVQQSSGLLAGRPPSMHRREGDQDSSEEEGMITLAEEGQINEEEEEEGQEPRSASSGSRRDPKLSSGQRAPSPLHEASHSFSGAAPLSTAAFRDRDPSVESGPQKWDASYRRDSRDREREASRYREPERDRDRERERDRGWDRDRDRRSSHHPYADARRFSDRGRERDARDPMSDRRASGWDREREDLARTERHQPPSRESARPNAPFLVYPIPPERDRWNRHHTNRERPREPTIERDIDALSTPLAQSASSTALLSGQEAIRNAYSRRRPSPDFHELNGSDTGERRRGAARQHSEEPRRRLSPTRSVTGGSDRGSGSYDRPKLIDSQRGLGNECEGARDREEKRTPQSKPPLHLQATILQKSNSAESEAKRTDAFPTPRKTPMGTPMDPGFVQRCDALVHKALQSAPATDATAMAAPVASPRTSVRAISEEALAGLPNERKPEVKTEPVLETGTEIGQDDRQAFNDEAQRHEVPVLSAAKLASPTTTIAVIETALSVSAPSTSVAPTATMPSEPSGSSLSLETLADLATAEADPASSFAPEVALVGAKSDRGRSSTHDLVSPTGSSHIEPVTRVTEMENAVAHQLATELQATAALEEDSVKQINSEPEMLEDTSMQDVQLLQEEEEHDGRDPEAIAEAKRRREEAMETAMRRSTLRMIVSQSGMPKPTHSIVKENRAVAQCTHEQLRDQSVFPDTYVEEGPLWLRHDDECVKAVQNRVRSIEVHRQKRLHVKIEQLRQQYRKLNDEWRVHCEHLNRWNERKERRSAVQTGTGTPAAEQDFIVSMMTLATSRTNRRNMNTGFAGFGDAVRSEAEFLEILASLESADMQDPTMRAARTTATTPNMLLDPDSTKPIFNNYEDNNGFVADPVAFYFNKFDPDFWSDEERTVFLRKYALYPKQFGKIASFLEHKTTQQCVSFYYATKKLPNYDYKALAAARNRERKRKVRPKSKKAKGSALMADLASTKPDDLECADDVDSPAEPGGITSMTGSRRKPTMTSNRFTPQEEHDEQRASSNSSRKRRATEDQSGDNINKKKSKKARRQKEPREPKAGPPTAAEEVKVIASVEEIPSEAAPSRALSDLAAAAVLEALAGVTPPEPVADKATGKRLKKAKSTFLEGVQEGKKKSRSSTSSYWSVAERTEFLKAFAMYGEDWDIISSTLPTKSAAQAKNFFHRMMEKESEESKDFQEAAQIAAENASLPLEQRRQEAIKMIVRQGASALAIIGSSIQCASEDGLIHRNTEGGPLQDASSGAACGATTRLRYQQPSQ